MSITHDRCTQIGSLLVSSDRNGNLTSDQNGTTYSYDAQPRRWEGRVRLPKAAPEGRDERERASQNRLIAVTTKTGTTMSVAYDAQYVAMGMARIDCAGAQPRAKAEGRAERERASQNRVVSRTINGDETTYVYDGWNLINEYDNYGIEDAHYIHGPAIDEILTRNATLGGTVYYTQDGNGNVTTLTDASGNVEERYSYDVYGMPSITSGIGSSLATSALGNRFLFTGREYLAEISLYDYRNRVYSPGLGRFLQTDPIRFDAGDINVYRYVGNSPVNWTDPLGLCNPKSDPTHHYYNDDDVNRLMQRPFKWIDQNSNAYHGDWLDFPAAQIGNDTDLIQVKGSDTYTYTGTQYPSLSGTTMSASDLNYLGVGAGYAAAGIPLNLGYVINQSWKATTYEGNSTSNINAATSAGYKAYKNK